MPMPWGKSKQRASNGPPTASEPAMSNDPATSRGDTNGSPGDSSASRPRPKLVFHCQQAHGSPTGVISGFTNVKELYQKIAECYDMDPAEILYCTLNTHKVDMSRLLGGQIGLEDFIFAHIKGRPKVVDITKNEDALGLTITDNGAGYAFIKRIKEGSIMDQFEGICVGDHIEKIDDRSLIGCRHFEVAKMLKEIPKGTTFTMRIVEPQKSGLTFMDKRQSGAGGKKGIDNGKKTLRLNKKGQFQVEEVDETATLATDKINGLLESFMGINDTELSQSIWEIGSAQDNPHNFAVALDESEIGAFGFSDDLVFDLWGAISDAKQGRLAKTTEFDEQF